MECSTDQSWHKGREIFGWEQQGRDVERRLLGDFAFDRSKFLDQKNHIYSASLNLLGCFELPAKLHVVAKVVN